MSRCLWSRKPPKRIVFTLTRTWDGPPAQVTSEPLHFDPPIVNAGLQGISSYPQGTGLGLGYSFAREAHPGAAPAPLLRRPSHRAHRPTASL